MEFRIKALDLTSDVITCVVDAVDEADARRQLALRELKVISLQPVRRLRRLLQSPHLQVAVFSQQLVSLLEAGLSLVEALEALAQKESNTATKGILDQILARLYEG
ncbi:MAG TPA: type II secretion system F family protein, partial [Steroidobacteraceae bacterium]|nr:type II secretion system F family protein [Steroidobacteraceae bacterium]